MRYKVTHTNQINPGIDSPEWENACEGVLGAQRWTEFYQPINVSFKLLKGLEGLSVLMHTDEKNLRAECNEENGMVCFDSCMEFFFKPDPWDVNYFNFELNPKGVLHLGLGSGRHDRTHIECDRSIFSIESRPDDGNWTLKFYIPDSFVGEYFKNIAPVCRGNFYKCGELTDHSHFITWSEVEVPQPDYHIPDFFGFIEL